MSDLWFEVCYQGETGYRQGLSWKGVFNIPPDKQKIVQYLLPSRRNCIGDIKITVTWGKWYALYLVTSFYRTSVLDVISSYDFLCCKWRKLSGQIGDFSGDFPENPLSSLSLGSKMNWHIFWIIPQGILSHTA